jgi:ABC-type transport system substrate-binding protein
MGPNDHYTLEANDKYWGDQPSVKKVVVSIIPDASTQNLMYQNGELDIIDLESLDSSIVQSTYKTTYAEKQLVSAPAWA